MSTPDEHEDIAVEETEDVHTDDVSLEDTEVSEAAKQKKLRAKLKACEAEKMQILEDLQRTKAEFLNSRKRIEAQAEQNTARALDAVIKDLLPLADSFDMAMHDTAAWEAVDAQWRKGVEGIHQQLQSLLKKHNVTAIDPTGEAFDPNEHEAVSSVDSESESDSVVSVVQKGYQRNDVIIRPAKVIISN